MPPDPRRGFFNLWATPKRRIVMWVALLALGTAGLMAWNQASHEPAPPAQPPLTARTAEASPAPTAAAGASKQGLPMWAIVAGMLAMAGAFGAFSMRRRRVTKKVDSIAPLPQMCPTCKMSFPPGRGFCPHDGNQLVRMVSSMAPRGKVGGICPTCEQGFDPGVQKCPVDGDTLVPAPVFQTAFAGNCGHEAGEKICPECGARTRPPSRFCETDGAELRPLH